MLSKVLGEEGGANFGSSFALIGFVDTVQVMKENGMSWSFKMESET